jgi:DNA replication protein DnaC
MSTNTIIDQIRTLRLSGFLQAFNEQRESLQYQDLSFEQRLQFLVDREVIVRANRKLDRMYREAELKIRATIDDINYDVSLGRGLKKQGILELAEGGWITQASNLIITGPTGVGKTFLACAIGDRLLRHDYQVRYFRAADLVQAIKLARADGSYVKLAAKLASYRLLIIDEWLRDPLSDAEARLLLDILDDRYRNASTLFVSQLEVAEWYPRFSDPTLADALLDRVVHNAHRLTLLGCVIAKQRPPFAERSATP